MKAALQSVSLTFLNKVMTVDAWYELMVSEDRTEHLEIRMVQCPICISPGRDQGALHMWVQILEAVLCFPGVLFHEMATAANIWIDETVVTTIILSSKTTFL